MSDYPGAVPLLAYHDAPAAIAFLEAAFGFGSRHRLAMPDGRIGHCELRLGTAVVMVSSEFPEMGLDSPRNHEARYSQVMVHVSDVDAHHANALANGATVAQPPADQPYGDRMYRAVDPEGHRWIFSQQVREVPFEEWSEAMGG